MPLRSAFVCLALLCVSAPTLLAGTDADYRKAIATIRCDCGCHPQSVKDCACGRAAEMRTEIQALVAGSSGKPPMDLTAVVAHYIALNGDQILIAPAARGFSLFAWLGPLFGLVLGIPIAVLAVRRFARRRNDEPPRAVPAPLAADDPYRERLRQQLAERD